MAMAVTTAAACCVSLCGSPIATTSGKPASSSRPLAFLNVRPIGLYTGRARGVDAFETRRSTRGKSSLSARFVVKATFATATEEDAPAKAEVSELKADLLAAVAGLDRGLVATKADEDLADTLALKLEAAGDTVVLPDDLDKLQGRWRLIFSSGFNTGSLGGQRPGPNITRVPLISIGLVYQRIDVAARELDNIVDLNFPVPWPLPPIQLTATLAHSFELSGGPNITIDLEKTIIKAEGGLSGLPPFEVPQIRIPDFVRTPANIEKGEFSTTYLDKDLRISRGDRGELRIFVRA